MEPSAVAGVKRKRAPSLDVRTEPQRRRIYKKCAHGKRKYQCVDCGGAGICEHKRIRSQCKECGGSAICEHGRQRARCKECGGGSICEHGRQRARCKECGGSAICEHGRIRSQCKDCVPLEKMLTSKLWCMGCTDKILSMQRQRAGIRFCAECDP